MARLNGPSGWTWVVAGHGGSLVREQRTALWVGTVSVGSQCCVHSRHHTGVNMAIGSMGGRRERVGMEIREGKGGKEEEKEQEC